MDRYIGLDVHAQSCMAVVLGPSGRRLIERPLETNAVVLRDFVCSVPRRRHLCLEEGTHSEWLFEILEPLVDELVVVQPGKSSGNKSDTIDAWTRAEELRQRNFSNPVYKAPGQYRMLREAVRSHLVLQRDVTRTKNRVKAIYRSRGVPSPGPSVYEAEGRSEWLAKLPPHCRRRANLLSSELDKQVELLDAAHKWLLCEARKVPEVKRLATAPGVGPIRAAQIVATVVTPHRFRTRAQFWSYCGLAIVTRSSADYEKDHRGRWVRKQIPQTRGLNRNRNPLLKSVFKGAAMTVVLQMSGHPLHEGYQRTLENTKPNLARLTLARRIAALVLAMWKNGEDYDVTRHAQRAT